MPVIRDENPKTLSGKVCRIKEMTGLSKSGLPSCAQCPALLISIPMFCDIFCFSELSLMRAQEVRNQMISKWVGEKGMGLNRGCHENG